MVMAAFAVAASGDVYRWILQPNILPDSLFWPQVGFNAARSFAYGGATLPVVTTTTQPLDFYSYPNPVSLKLNNGQLLFRYKFSAPATNVRLDIITFSGFSVYSTTAMGTAPTALTGSSPDWNELRIPITNIGPGLYRCRLEAVVSGKKVSQIWKMAVTR